MDAQKLYSYLRQADKKYRLIEAGDHIAAAVSGGKDSLALLWGLAGLRRFYPKPFKLTALTVDLGFHMDYEPLKAFCRELDTELVITETQIGEIVFEHRKCDNPCSLCAKMRRGALIGKAKELGCSKIALGHHREDIVETMMMSMLYQGNFYAISPYTYYEDSRIAMIRPMTEIPQREIEGFVKRNNFPVIKNLCPNDNSSARKDMDRLLKELQKKYPDASERFYHSIENSGIEDWVNAKRERKSEIRSSK